MRRAFVLLLLAALAVLAAGCGEDNDDHPAAKRPVVKPPRVSSHALPGMPPVLNPLDVYSADRPGRIAAAARGARPLIYVPNSESNTVDEIDPRTYRIVRHFATGRLPQHVVPSWDLKTLWVANDYGNSLTAIDPTTGAPGTTIPVADPYNMYFTPDGRYAIVVAERLGRLDFRDAHTMRLHRSLPVPAREWTIWTSPPTAATRWRAVSSPVAWW